MVSCRDELCFFDVNDLDPKLSILLKTLLKIYLTHLLLVKRIVSIDVVT